MCRPLYDNTVGLDSSWVVAYTGCKSTTSLNDQRSASQPHATMPRRCHVNRTLNWVSSQPECAHPS
eukprot:34250-Eustigmatos_ZCMA.PRE.1